jgi:formate-dependent nitrite reductase membrane component NrfD
MPNTARQWMVTHNWMVEGNRQTEWIDRKGILLWLAFYTGGLGGGVFLVSLFANSLLGMFIGWFIVACIKGPLHLFFLGKPARFWRLLFHPMTSWLSRGLYFVFSFMGFGFLTVLLIFLTQNVSGMPDLSIVIWICKVLAAVFALCTATYTGFVLNNVKGVPFWGWSFLPVLFVACGILGGFGVNVALSAFDSGMNQSAIEMGSRIMLVINVIIIVLYLAVEANRQDAGKKSVLMQLRGSLAGQFWIGVVILGIAVPAIIAISSLFTGEATAWVLVTGTCCEVIGGAMLRYCVLKSGVYNPIFATDSIIKRGQANVRA